ncbi:MAG: hypothetical protein ABL898_06915 [Hyphomicrobiaceae bacterium]
MADTVRLTMLFAAIAEAAVMVAAASGHLPLGGALICHCGIVLMLVVATVRARGSDKAGTMFTLLIVTAVTGPFGAWSAMLLPWLARRRRDSTNLLEQWYERISNSTATDRLTLRSDHVAIGRAADLGAPSPAAYAELFTSRNIAGQQTALGMIAREFHPDYIPALRLALNSTEPIVRVQAAAVTARVRDKINAYLTDGIAKASASTTTHSTAIALIEDVEVCAKSGLVGESEAERARAAASAATLDIMARLDIKHRAGEALHLDAIASRAYEQHLLATRQFDAFRLRRNHQRLPIGGRMRRRTIIKPPAFVASRHRRSAQV